MIAHYLRNFTIFLLAVAPPIFAGALMYTRRAL